MAKDLRWCSFMLSSLTTQWSCRVFLLPLFISLTDVFCVFLTGACCGSSEARDEEPDVNACQARKQPRFVAHGWREDDNFALEMIGYPSVEWSLARKQVDVEESGC